MNERSRSMLDDAYRTISDANRRFFEDVFLISNQVLSRNPFNNNYLKRCLGGDDAPKGPRFLAILKAAQYYAKSFAHLLAYCVKYAEWAISGPRFPIGRGIGEIVLIDSFFFMEDIRRDGVFRDMYFPGLEAVLQRKAVAYAYLPFFDSASRHRRPFELSPVLRILKRDKVPVLTEFQLLSAADLGRLLHFILAYPFRVLRAARSISGDTREKRLLKYELVDALDKTTFYNHIRYLVGRALASMPVGKIRLISWYENHPVHKNLYRGLRDGGANATIYGAQLLLYSKDLAFIVPDENEEPAGVIPDKIITNGPFYVPEKTRFKYSVGPALRYGRIYDTVIKSENRTETLVLLPYFLEGARRVLRAVSEAGVGGVIRIKPHRALPIGKLKKDIPAAAVITDEGLYKLFETARCVVGTASGTLIEAASLGIAVVSVNGTGSADFSNPLPEYGRGIVWEEAADGKELKVKMGQLDEVFRGRRQEVEAVALRYKEMFFSPVNEERLREAFDL